MNDIGYINESYKESILYRSTPTELWQLKQARPYTTSAIAYHCEEGNPKQVQIFKEHLAELDKRIKALEDKKFREWLSTQGQTTENVDVETLREIFDAMDDEDKYQQVF